MEIMVFVEHEQFRGIFRPFLLGCWILSVFHYLQKHQFVLPCPDVKF